MNLSGRAMEYERAGAAFRRWERRLRSWLKHERMTVAMALAESLHHSAQRPEKAEEQDKHGALRRQKALPPRKRPGVLSIGQQCGVGFELVQALAVPVLQMVEQHVEVLSFLSSCLLAVAEQVIEVPALSLPVCAVQRVVPLEPQMAEQLVEVPTVLSPAVLQVLSYALLQQQTAEQIIDVPVPLALSWRSSRFFSRAEFYTAYCGAERRSSSSRSSSQWWVSPRVRSAQ